MNRQDSRYRLEVVSRDGALIADLTPRVRGRNYRQRRNRAEVLKANFDLEVINQLALRLNVTVEQLFAVNQNQLKLFRDDTLIGAGEINYLGLNFEGDSVSLDVQAVGWLEWFAYRLTGVAVEGGDWYYDAVDAGQIAASLITTSQAASSFGVTIGSIQPSVPRDRKTYANDNIRDEIVALSEVDNGFDFEFTPDKVFNVYYPKIGTRRNDITFTFPGNIQKLTFNRDGTLMANKVYAVGSGFGTERYQSVVEDATSQASYRIREKMFVYNNVSDTNTLTEHGNEELRVRRSFLDVPEITLMGDSGPSFGSYKIGDEVQLDITERTEAFGSLNDWFRIEEIDLSIDENDVETVRIKMSR